MKPTERKWKRAQFCHIERCGSLKGLERIVNEAREAVKSGEWRDLSLDTSEPYEDYVSIGLFGERPETDPEQEKRLKDEAEQKSAQEQRDRVEFERLQLKFQKPK